MADISVELGRRMRAIRKEQNMTQEAIAFKADISPAHLGQIERAQKHPTIETIGKIAQALEVPVTDLFAFDAEPRETPIGVTLNKINAQLVSLTEEEQKDILRLIRVFKGFREHSD